MGPGKKGTRWLLLQGSDKGCSRGKSLSPMSPCMLLWVALSYLICLSCSVS